ncbi:MAG TPA: DUF4337 family protein [Candidatus Baltobacteraceae bacterium]|nr:DUF4337 family protein [Candidatus Baltobacteraceae bacterium]
MSAHAAAPSHDRFVPFFTAIVAVLAALGTLFAHHRSIQALSLRNDAVLATVKASDQYGYYQTKQLKVTLYQALNRPSGVAEEQRTSLAIYAQAKALETQAEDEQKHSESYLTSFETLEIATTLFEISIAFASIAALTDSRMILYAGAALTAIGLVLGVVGYLQAH